MANTDLSYNIASLRLTGNVDGTIFNTIAASGGRGGSKTAGAVHQTIANNPFLTSLKKDDKKGTIGGPLPMGIYTLQLHEVRLNWIRLIPRSVVSINDRAGFAIHGRGAEGSHGCIVPRDFTVLQSLYKLVKERKANAKPPVTLTVYAEGDLDQYMHRLNTV